MSILKHLRTIKWERLRDSDGGYALDIFGHTYDMQVYASSAFHSVIFVARDHKEAKQLHEHAPSRPAILVVRNTLENGISRAMLLASLTFARARPSSMWVNLHRAAIDEEGLRHLLETLYTSAADEARLFIFALDARMLQQLAKQRRVHIDAASGCLVLGGEVLHTRGPCAARIVALCAAAGFALVRNQSGYDVARELCTNFAPHDRWSAHAFSLLEFSCGSHFRESAATSALARTSTLVDFRC